jgi:transposase
MKKFTRVKRVGGYDYLYEITPYYDKKTKNTKQKTKYLGKLVDGELVRPRTRLPKSSFDFGEFLPFMKVLDELPITKILESLMRKSQASTILVLALNRVVQPVALMNARNWYEGTYLSKEYGNLPLSSQSLSEFMEELGGSGIPMRFSEGLVKAVGTEGPLLYDITSLSSSSGLMDILEWGYNRDFEQMPQLNLSVVAHGKLGIPLFFDVHPGSIVDVTTLKNTMKKIESLGLKGPTLIMDRGFFSGPNVGALLREGYDFVMPASYSRKEVRSLVASARRDIENARYLVKYEDVTLFVKPVKLEFEEGTVDGFAYYDMGREKDEKARFYSQLHDVIDRLRSRRLRDWEAPSKVFEDITRDFSGYLGWRIKGDRFEVDVKDKAVAQRVNRMGFTVVIYRGAMGWEEALAWSRERDEIERMFRQLKSDIEVKPLRAHKTEVAKGWIFVTFISLILRSRLTRMLKESGLSEDYSIPSLVLELGKLKRVELTDGSFMTTEVTKRQRGIFEKLGITP